MVTFDACFDRRKVSEFQHLIPATYEAMEELAGYEVCWPKRIQGITAAEAREGERIGKGHGLYFPETGEIKINARMSAMAIYLNFIHENMHHALPEATEKEINGEMVPWVYEYVTGKKLPDRLAKPAGIRNNPVPRSRRVL